MYVLEVIYNLEEEIKCGVLVGNVVEDVGLLNVNNLIFSLF